MASSDRLHQAAEKLRRGARQATVPDVTSNIFAALADTMDEIAARHPQGGGWCERCRQNSPCGVRASFQPLVSLVLGAEAKASKDT